MSTKTELYQQDARGNIRMWSIETFEDKITIRYGLKNGAIQTKDEYILGGKATRTQEEQVESRFESRINKQLDRGYKRTMEEAQSKVGTNALNLQKPMLAKPYKDVRDISYAHAYVQPKFDGHRCLMTMVNGKVTPYSRQGKLITTIDHITKGIVLDENITLDGELYCHGESLQSITSWIKKKQDNTLRLVYNVYDSISGRPFAERFGVLEGAIAGAKFAVSAVTERVHSYPHARVFYHEAKKVGYEGAILRWGLEGYQAKRSKYLVKIKSKVDADFRVIDIERSKDGWGILVCATEADTIFRVNAPGGYEEKRIILKNKLKYINTKITVEYANLTKDGIPFHPVALRFVPQI